MVGLWFTWFSCKNPLATPTSIPLTFLTIFGNIVKHFNISQYSDLSPIIENIKDPTFKLFQKKSNILAIRTKCNRNGGFSFKEVCVKKIETEIRLSKLNKHLNIQIYQLKLSRKTQIYFQTSFARVLIIP